MSILHRWHRSSGMILGLIVLGYAVSAGCRQSAPSSSAAEQSESGGDHGHGRPAHKPYTFRAAVNEVSRRGHELLHQKPSDPAAASQLLDIIRWLPELAAETDLTRVQWEEVQSLSMQLETWALSAIPSDHAALDQFLGELRKLLVHIPQPAGGNSESAPDHDHDHRHHAATQEPGNNQ